MKVYADTKETDCKMVLQSTQPSQKAWLSILIPDSYQNIKRTIKMQVMTTIYYNNTNYVKISKQMIKNYLQRFFLNYE